MFDTALNEVLSVERARDEHLLDPDSVGRASVARWITCSMRRGSHAARCSGSGSPCLD